jgi:hypothetical protein
MAQRCAARGSHLGELVVRVPLEHEPDLRTRVRARVRARACACVCVAPHDEVTVVALDQRAYPRHLRGTA